MDAEDRLKKIRSIIRETERNLELPACDQLSLLRSAFVAIIQAAGPQSSGSRRVSDERRKRKA